MRSTDLYKVLTDHRLLPMIRNGISVTPDLRVWNSLEHIMYPTIVFPEDFTEVIDGFLLEYPELRGVADLCKEIGMSNAAIIGRLQEAIFVIKFPGLQSVLTPVYSGPLDLGDEVLA